MKIAIYGQYYKPEDKIYVEELLQILQEQKIEYVIERGYFKGLKQYIQTEKVKTFNSYKDLNNSFDYMFTVGGDGTILRAVTFIRDLDIPIIGINTGRLGFLATVQKEHIKNTIDLVLKKEYIVKERSLLSVTTIPKTNKLSKLNFALNEVSVSRKNTASMITIETYLDNEYLTSYWADGLIAATPTGSTGYSLSCGGPIISPQAKSFALTPIAPHNLNARPIIIPDDTEIELIVSGREDFHLLSLDSRIISVKNEDIIKINKAKFSIMIAHLNEDSFYKTLRNKLLWGEDKRNT